MTTHYPEGDGSFLVYRTRNEYCHINTNLEDYRDDIREPLDGVLTYLHSELTRGYSTELRYSIRLENVTSFPTGAGTWVQAKHHIDRCLTIDDLSGRSAAASLATPLYLQYPHHSYLEDFILADIDICKDFADYTSSWDE